ncbi:MAG: hypothetical protein K0Q57_1077 [Gammaproteobacteria bacterium]|jgi:hypothetical protein|nr:hypothetical protein [Gammaproteobacteria bacterium]
MPKVHLISISLSTVLEGPFQTPYTVDLIEAHKDMAKEAFLSDREFSIAKILLLNPKTIAMLEGLPQALDFAKLSAENVGLAKEALETFPGGTFPESLHELKAEQKTFLVRHGAAKTLLLLGKIEHIYPFIETGDMAKLFQQVNDIANIQNDKFVCIALVHNSPNDKVSLKGMGNIVSVSRLDSLGQIESDLTKSIHFNSASTFYQQGRLRNSYQTISPPVVSSESLLQIGVVFLAFFAAVCCSRRKKPAQSSSTITLD